jgi:hypothetical protein
MGTGRTRPNARSRVVRVAVSGRVLEAVAVPLRLGARVEVPSSASGVLATFAVSHPARIARATWRGVAGAIQVPRPVGMHSGVRRGGLTLPTHAGEAVTVGVARAFAELRVLNRPRRNRIQRMLKHASGAVEPELIVESSAQLAVFFERPNVERHRPSRAGASRPGWAEPRLVRARLPRRRERGCRGSVARNPRPWHDDPHFPRSFPRCADCSVFEV